MAAALHVLVTLLLRMTGLQTLMGQKDWLFVVAVTARLLPKNKTMKPRQRQREQETYMVQTPFKGGERPPEGLGDPELHDSSLHWSMMWRCM